MKKRKILLMIMAIFVIQSCDHTEAYFGGEGSGINPPTVYSRISDIIKFDNITTETLSFDPSVDSEVTGSFGTKIILPAGSVSGTNLPSELFVKLREYPTLSKMAIGSVQTVSNQDLLVTGGNFWWEIQDAEGNTYQLTSPSQVMAEQTVVLDMGNYQNAAMYFQGQEVDVSGLTTVNWSAIDSNASFGENNIFNYYGIDLHWVNCDVLYDYPGGRTQFTVGLNTQAEITSGEEVVILIVDDFPSVMYLPNQAAQQFAAANNSIPVGITGTLIGVAIDTDDNLHIGSTAITVAGDDSFSIDLTQGSTAQLQNLINQATN